MDWLHQDIGSKLHDFINVVLPEIILSNASDDKRSALFKHEAVIQNDGRNVLVYPLPPISLYIYDICFVT